MSDDDLAFHFVCTLDEAREILSGHDRLWVSNCNCREHRGPCRMSRADVCLQFAEHTAADGSNKREVSREVVDEIFREAGDKHLVPRPFRNEEDDSLIDGICFCCNDCCGYFYRGRQEKCDKGPSIEVTDLEKCTECGLCVDVCYFEARALDRDGLLVDKDKCYGCGLCVDVCPERCIRMIKRRA